MKVFGREPALGIGVVGAVLTVLAAFGEPFGISAGVAAAVVALLTGLATAATTRPWQPGFVTAIVTPAVALFAEYGVNFSDNQVAAVTGAAIIIMNFVLRTSSDVSPVESPVSRA